MLAEIIKRAGLDKDTCASLLGFDRDSFSAWTSGQKTIPESARTMLAAVFGVPSDALAIAGHISDALVEKYVPSIWYKLRGTMEMSEADRDYALLSRLIAFYISEFEEAVGTPPLTWRTLFNAIRENTNFKASPKEQGVTAAKVFRNETGLAHGKGGIGDLIRGHLKSKGILVIESAIQGSKIEGFCFLVGTGKAERPCVFANNYALTWYRRNFVMMHEVCHGIYDAETQGAAVDFASEEEKDLSEARAQAFAQEVLVPKDVLKHLSKVHQVNWGNLTARSLAELVGATSVEAKVVLKAALEAGFIDAQQQDAYKGLEIAKDLREVSSHSLSYNEYAKKSGIPTGHMKENRETSLSSRKVVLPLSYCKAVVEACENGQLSSSRGAELLMVDEDLFRQRFGSRLQSVLQEDE